MNGRHIVERRRGPERFRRNRIDTRGEVRGLGTGRVDGLMEDRAIQPDDPLGRLSEFRSFVVVRRQIVQLDVAVHEGMRMAGVGPVRMERRERGAEDEVRRDDQPGRRARKRTKHGAIMSAGHGGVKRLETRRC